MYALLTDVIIIICLTIRYGAVFSSAETNLKEGGTPPEIFFVVPFHFFWLCKSFVLASAFVMVTIQFGQFLVCCSTHGVPVPSHL